MFYFHSQFSDLKNKITSQIASLFPRKGKLNTLRLKRIWVEDKLQADDYSAQKDARLKERTWAVPVYGDFELVNNATGKVIDTQDRVRLALMPKMTSRGSFVVNGSEYQVSNMLRLKPGVYTVIQANGVLDSWVNLAKGKNFNVMLDPKTGIFTIKVGTANVKLYPLLIAMGANASDIKSAWGAELADQNASKGDYDTEILKAHKAFIGKPVANVATAIADLTAYFGKTELSPEVTKTTLGQSFSGASADLLLATSKKILSVSRGQGKTDDRDALEFKTVHSVEDLLPERIAKTSQALARSIDRNIDRKNLVRHIISADTFGMPIETFFTGSDEFAGLAQVTPQTNPLSMLGETNKTTTLGPGGIGSVHSITLESRAVNPTSFAFLDPIQSPEGEKVGTTMHIATAARKVGNSLVIRVIDAKTGKLHDLNAIEASRVIIAFSDQYVRRGKKMVAKSAIVKAVRGGEFVNAPRSQVDYIFPSAKGFFSFAANMVPFLHSDQGNRAMMASKMIEQALPLKYREAPMVETQLSSGTTFGSMLGEAYSVRSPAEGRISKITKDAIVVKDARGKSHTVNVPSKLPLNSHVYLDADPLVKVGDKVKSGQLLADSNFTKDGKMALGTGLRTAFVPYRGLNFEDAVVISDSAAKKLTSLHMHQESVDVDQGVVLSLKKFKAYYPGIIDAEATKKLDDDGVVRVGQKVKAGDVLIAALREEHMGPESDMLRKLHRSFVQPYRNAAVTWTYEDEGTVTDVAKSGKRVTVYVTTEEPAKVGSKLCYSEDTELLTWDGWKKVSEVTTMDKLASLGPCGQLEYIQPVAIHSYDHDGRMYSLETIHASLLVTENHHLYAKPRAGSTKCSYGLHRADQLFGTSFRLKKNADILLPGVDPLIKKFPDYITPGGRGGSGIRRYQGRELSSECYAFLLGAFISEGCVRWEPDCGNFGIEIYQTKPDGLAELKAELDRFGLKYCQGSECQVLYGKDLALEFSKISPPKEGRISHLKRIPEEVWGWTPHLQSILLKWLMWGDGVKSTNRYCTTSKGLADDFQRLALHVGMSGNIYVRPAYQHQFNGKQYVSQAREAYYIGLVDKSNHPEVNYRPASKRKGQTERWVHYAGKVYCPELPRNHVIYIRRRGKSLWCGNSNRHGAKGIVSAIIPDAQMPHTAKGESIQMISNPNGIIGRINLGQMLETAAGKIAERDGKPFIVDNFSGENYVAKIKKELKARGLSDKEDIFDPGLNKTIPHVLVGNQYVMQLDHPVRKKFSARSTGGYTMDMQPPQGGGQGGQGIGKMEFAALVAHNVPHLIQEAATIRGHKNDEYWRMLQAGMPLPAPETPFSFQKLETMIKGMGVDVRKEGHELELSPMTDAQILKQSNGEIKDALAVRAKDLRPEKGGIFDPESTGGVGGRHYNHVSLSEATPNPIFEMAIRELLGLTEKDYREYVDGHKWIHKDGSAATKDSRGAITGGEAIKALLGKIDVDKTLAELRRTAKNMRGADLEKANRKMRYLSALKEKSLSPTVYVLDNFPVIPAMFRPVYQLPNGNLGISQINELYRDTILVNNQLGDKKLPDDLKANLRKDLYDGLKGIVGLGTSLSGRKRKGFIEQISGDSPKTGYFQSRVMGRRQDLSGRSTIVPGPNLGLDEVAIPEQMAWKLYEPFVIRELGTMGYTPLQAKEHLEQKDELARKALEVVASDRPVFLNRAPTLHKFSIMAFKPKLVSGQAIKMNPLVVQGFNADHDGDQQFNSVLLLANEAAMAIISGSASFGRRWLEDRIVTARFKVELPLLNERDEILMVHLEDFPHGDVLYSKEGRNGPIEFYSVPAGIKVLAHDASTGEVAWRDVTVWSVHRDRRVEIVNLSSGRQIITDDDPRAVYGVDRGSLSLVRRTPQDALDHKMLVPRIDRIGCGRDTVAQLNTAEANNRNTDIKLVNPMPVDRKLGYVIGSVCGDGWVADGKNGPKDVCLAGISDEVQDRFYECLRSLYVSAAPEPCVQHSPDSMGPSRKYTYTSACLANFLAPLVGRKAHGKHLPPWFLGACREFREGLFAGLMDTDGTVSVSNGKAKPQLQCTYTSVSLRLVQEVKFLAASLGVRGRISRSRTPAGADFWVLAFSTVDFKKCGDTGMCHSEKLVRMQSTAVADNSPSACASDVVPISRDLAEAMQLAMGAPRNRSKEMTSLYQIALKAKDSGKITRKSAQALMAKLSSFSHPDYERWSCIVNDTQVCWDEVESVEKTDCRETGYDLTVPGFETFMSVDGVILSNTLAVHVPISEEARREAIGMLPSNNLFSPRDGSLMNLPSQEAVLGLYLATSDSKKTNAKFKSTRDAIRAYITGKHDLADEVSVGGRRMTIGQAAINEVLPAEYRERDLVVTKKKLASLLNSLAKQKPQVFADVVSKLKDIGNEHAYRSGFSVGLEDLTVNTGARDRIFAEADRKAKKVGITAAYSEATKKLEDELKRELIAKKNPFYQMVVSGARGNMSQLRQILGAPVLVKDMNDQPIPVPIKKSFAEGLSIADYLATLPGARKGILDKSLMTSKPGAFSKELVSAAISQRVSMADCGTHNGKSLATDDPDALDHYLAKGVGRRAHRNQLVTPALVSKLKGRVKTIVVRTPATCEAPNGVCQMCYGLDEHGHKASVGRNVGVLAAQTISEPLTQFVLKCLSKDTVIAVRINGVQGNMTLEEAFKLDGALESDGTLETKAPQSKIEVWDGYTWASVSSIQRHQLERPMKFLSVKGGAQICQDNHPVVCYENDTDHNYCKCGRKLMPTTDASGKAMRLCSNGHHVRGDQCSELDPVAWNGNPRIVEAEQAFGRVLVSLEGYRGKHNVVPDLDGYLVGSYLAEGCVRIGNGTKRYENRPVAIEISSYDAHHQGLIAESVKRSGWKCRVWKKGVSIYDPSKAARIRDLCPGYAYDKRLTLPLCDLSKDWLVDLLAGVLDGDGTVTKCYDGKMRNSKIYTSSFALAQQIQIVCGLLGISSNILTMIPNAEAVKTFHQHSYFSVEMKIPAGHALRSRSFKAAKLDAGYRPHNTKIISGLAYGKLTSKLFFYDDRWVYDIKTSTGMFVAGCMQTHNSFHTGSVAEVGKPSIVGGFARVKEILEMNEVVHGKATLAENTGKVQAVRKSPTGGEIVTVAGTEHFVDPGRTVVVKVGDHVHKGDRLSDGSIKPQELLDLKGVAAVRDYLTGELKKEYASQGIKVKAKIFDTVIRPLVNAAQVTDPGASKYLPGDVTTLSAIQSFNRGKPDNEHIKFEPKLKGVNTYPLMSHDWLERLNYQQLAKTLTQGPAQGWKANILHSPVGAYATGTLMGREKRAEALEIEPEAPEGVALEDLEIPEIMAELNNA